MTILRAYTRYPFRIPLRVKFFNLFRLMFRFSVPEKFLVRRITNHSGRLWSKLIPPLYFYSHKSIRQVERNRIRFRLDISKQLDHSIYFCTVKDLAWSNLLQLLKPDFNVIDVGANIGFLTLNFATRCPEGKTYSFEPDSETFSKLKMNVALNRLNNVRLFHTAIGSKAGTGQLYKLYQSNPGANRILPHEHGPAVPSERVEISSLDDLDSEGCFGSVDLIKIDVEGFELFVLEGAHKLISRCKPVLFIELVDQNLKLQGCSSTSVLDYITRLDYLILDAKTMRPLGRSEDYYTDILCFPHSNSM